MQETALTARHHQCQSVAACKRASACRVVKLVECTHAQQTHNTNAAKMSYKNDTHNIAYVNTNIVISHNYVAVAHPCQV